MSARRRGRPHQGAQLVEKLEDGSEVARQRMKVIFQTLAGVFTVEQACQILQINRSAFNKDPTRGDPTRGDPTRGSETE